MKKHNSHLATAVFSLLLAAFTVYISLDTFVLASAYQQDATAMNMTLFEQPSGAAANAGEASSAYAAAEQSEASAGAVSVQRKEEESEESADETSEALSGASVEPVVTETSYQDENITIVLSEYETQDTTVYVADVTVSSAEYLKTAFAQNSYGKNITASTSEMAEEHDAILAINGDYYGAQERGYVIRNGVIYRDSAGANEVLCILTDGSLLVVSPEDYTAQELLDMGTWQAFSFGPGLIEDGQISVSTNDEVGKAKASNPRTAIGMIDELHYVFVVSDGRTEESEGLSLYELAEFMQSLGVQTAYNLDGGGSSTMVFMGKVINNPTTNGNKIKERSVSDIVYIG